MKIAFFGSSLVSAYWNGAATYYRGIIRALIYYPMSLGRNIDEILRVVDALQTADTNACATPANWRPGDKVVVPPPQTIDDAEKRLQSDYEITDWYLAKRTLS